MFAMNVCDLIWPKKFGGYEPFFRLGLANFGNWSWELGLIKPYSSPALIRSDPNGQIKSRAGHLTVQIRFIIMQNYCWKEDFFWSHLFKIKWSTPWSYRINFSKNWLRNLTRNLSQYNANKFNTLKLMSGHDKVYFRQIDKQLIQDKRLASSIIKLLLLGKANKRIIVNWIQLSIKCIKIFLKIGAGECGKSTILKQMQ